MKKDNDLGKMSRNALLLIVSLLFCLLIVEGTVRVQYGERFAQRPTFRVPDSTFGWKPNANLDAAFFGEDFVMQIRTDESGYRLGARGPVDSVSNLIVAVGDSYTFGWGVNSDETFPSFLDERLAANTSNRLVNLGVGGYGTSQSARALERFLSTVETSRVETIVVFHAGNDATDNVRFELFRSGEWSLSHTTGNSSRLHVVNLVRRIWFLSKGNSGRAAARPHVLPIEWDGFEDTILRDGRRVTEEDLSRRQLHQRQATTVLQRSLLEESIEDIHCLLPDRGIPILHLQLHYKRWRWYERELGEIIENAEKCGNEVSFTGIVVVPDSCEACGVNQHSGGHFNPPLNKFYGDYIFDLLQLTSVVSTESDG